MNQLERLRYRDWLSGSINPPVSAMAMTNDQIADVLEVVLDDMCILDRRSIFIHEAVKRLRAPHDQR